MSEPCKWLRQKGAHLAKTITPVAWKRPFSALMFKVSQPRHPAEASTYVIISVRLTLCMVDIQ